MYEFHASSPASGIHASARDVLCGPALATFCGAQLSVLRDAESHNPRLPIEIQEHILDHLHDDLSALQACCLTNTAWVPTTRLHLFRCIRLRCARDCLRFLATLESTSDSGEGGRASVGVLVRELHLPTMNLLQKGVRSGRRYDLLRRILRRLPNVDELYFEWFDWQCFLDLLLPDLPNLSMPLAIATVFDFPRLKALFLWSLAFRSRTEFRALVAAFPHVETLQIRAPSCPRLPGDLAMEHAYRDSLGRCLRDLHIEAKVFIPGTDYLAALLEGSTVFGSQLRKLHWDCFGPYDNDGVPLARVLVRAAKTLRELEIDMRSLKGINLIPSNGFPELRSLERLRLVYIPHTAFPQLLSTFGLHVVQEIVLEIDTVHSGLDGAALDLSQDWDFIDWQSATESLLSLHQINPAATVTFVFVGVPLADPPHHPAGYTMAALAKAVARHLGRVVEAGLQVSVLSDSDRSHALVLTSELASAQ